MLKPVKGDKVIDNNLMMSTGHVVSLVYEVDEDSEEEIVTDVGVRFGNVIHKGYTMDQLKWDAEASAWVID